MSATLLFAILIALFWCGAVECCAMSKKDAHNCAKKKCDFDRDGKVSELEILFIYEKRLPYLVRLAAEQISSVAKVIRDCGDTSTGLITEESFVNAKECLERPAKTCLFKGSVCRMFQDVTPDTPEGRALIEEYREYAASDHSDKLTFYTQQTE